MLGGVNTYEEVLEAARRRAAALATGDPEQLRSLLHPKFRWVSHTGERFDRDSYVESNTSGTNRWSSQRLSDIDVVAHPQTAVLRCQVVDEVDHGDGVQELRMPMTQVWVRHEDRWVCLVGHAGPSLSEGS
jgi:Domain of unknown function (DUF4440)